MNKLFENKMFVLTLVLAIIIFVLIVINVFAHIKQVLKEKKHKLNLVQGLTIEETTQILKMEKEKKKKEKKVSYPFKKLLDEYRFFGGSISKLLKIVVVGYMLTFVLYLLVTKELLCAFVFSLYFFLAVYLIVDAQTKNKRLSYLKGFAASLEILSASIEVGDSLETAINNVQKRDKLNPRILNEFAILSNNIKSNMSLDESLEHFWKRNNVFEEFSMFVIVLQFFMKSGGRNLSKMFNSMKVSVQQKVENYSLIESKIGSYSGLFKVIIAVNIAFTLLGGLFIENFHASLTEGMGILKMVGSVGLTFISCYLFNMFVRGAAEA